MDIPSGSRSRRRAILAGFWFTILARRVSSVAWVRTGDALNDSWDKNDPKDAQVILHMLQIGLVQFFHDCWLFTPVSDPLPAAVFPEI